MTPERSGDAAKSRLYLLLMQDKRWWNQNSPHPALTSAFQCVLHSLPLSVTQCFHFLPPSALLSFPLAQRGFCYTLKAPLCVYVCAFAGWRSCWTNRSGFPGARIRFKQRPVVCASRSLSGTRGRVCRVRRCVPVASFPGVLSIVSQFLCEGP